MTRAPHGYPDDLRAQVEAFLAGLDFLAPRNDDLDGLRDAMRYALQPGGKRVRPVLALATARAIGEDPALVLPVAAAVELIHTHSLIHDDLPAMDNDDMRRGRPSCHRQYGEAVALLAGTGLYAEAFRLVLTSQCGEPRAVAAAVGELAAATGIGGMVGGQFLDVGGGPAAGSSGLRRIHALKTGRLIGASVIGPLIALRGADAEEITAFRAFASELGVLFQIVDDLLDANAGSDRRLGRRTYVSEFGAARARSLADESHRACRAALAVAAPGGAPELEQLVEFCLARRL
jgi:geranylgeranyl diphosphate synthase type II